MVAGTLGDEAADRAEPIAAKGVPAVRRATAILWLLAERSTPLSLSQIARAVDILPSTALQILREMAAARLIAFDPALKVYKLGSGIVDLAQAVIRHDDFAEHARPWLQAISARFDVTATATEIIDEHHTACVVSISPPSGVSLNVTLGGRVPILSGAFGRCIAAFGDTPTARLKRRFDRIRWQAPLDFDVWLKQVEAARVRGYGEDESLFARGVTTLAAPVFARDGSVTRAIGIATISAMLDADGKRAIASSLIDAAAEISRQLGL